MTDFLSTAQLKSELKHEGFVLKTQQQIAKDFAQSGIDFGPAFSAEPLSLEDILNSVEIHVHALIKLGEPKLLQLLYQVDIPQSQFLSLVGNSSFVEEISNLILRREAFKVYLRSKF